MDKKALAQQLLDGFGKTLTVGALTLDERTSSCVLIFDEQLVINIEYDEQTQRLVLSSYLHELPATGAEPLLRELLAANLYWHRTNGATLCLEEGTGGVMQNFATQAERWTRRLAQAAQALQPQAEPLARPGTPVLFG